MNQSGSATFATQGVESRVTPGVTALLQRPRPPYDPARACSHVSAHAASRRAPRRLQRCGRGQRGPRSAPRWRAAAPSGVTHAVASESHTNTAGFTGVLSCKKLSPHKSGLSAPVGRRQRTQVECDRMRSPLPCTPCRLSGGERTVHARGTFQHHAVHLRSLQPLRRNVLPEVNTNFILTRFTFSGQQTQVSALA